MLAFGKLETDQVGFHRAKALEVLEEGGFSAADVALDGESVRPARTRVVALVDNFWVVHDVRSLRTA